MDMVSPVLDIFSRLWTCSAHNTDYVRKLKQNLNTLETSFSSLRYKRDDLNRRIEMEEANPTEPAKRTNVVTDWLQRVEFLETEVQRILDDNEAIKNDRGCYFWCWGRKNCWSAYRLGRLVFRKQIDVESLSREGVFQDVTYRCEPDPLQHIPTVEVVGMDAKFNEVVKSLVTEGNDVRVVGLYGMGGVGKTTLLRKVNNEFTERKQFDLVIFVEVYKNLNIKRIQTQIGEKLGISWKEETEIYKRGSDIFKVLQKKKFLLLLDDIWEGFNLDTIGVSKDAFQIKQSKVVFTTRDKKVCGFMDAEKKIRIECLEEDQAWSLFEQKVGQEALSCHSDVPEVAKKIAKECRGLPLALITIGCTMSSKTDLHQWQHALHTLQESASQFSGMAEKVLAIMKYSYDNLENQKLKSCFLNCSLAPEDFSFGIDCIIGVWIGEGLLDNVDDYTKAQNEGHDVINGLKDACLLETGIELGVKMESSAKMHDVVRDLATWIASDLGGEEKKYLTLQAESTLKLHEWEKAERISLIGNRAIEKLYGEPHCSNLITLLLLDNNVSVISDDFFRFMPMLKVLQMKYVELKKLPTSIFLLSQLQNLQLPEYDKDVVLASGSLSSLTKMKILCLSESCCQWESLQHLIYLEITIGTGLALQRLVSSQKLQWCTKSLKIKYCPTITSLTFLPSLPSQPVSLVSLEPMIGLSFLFLEGCYELEELRIMSCNEYIRFTTLEYLFLFSMPKLKILWDMPQQSFCSVNLKHVFIRGCPQLDDLTWLTYAHNLESLLLEDMDGLEEIISNEFATEERLINYFSRLKCLVLTSLRNLKRICDHNVRFVLLEKISVRGCPELKNLPFNSSSVICQDLKKITGEIQWWQSLEWEDEATKYNLAPYCYHWL
ncbi:hypothetical protein MKW92_042288 [Papaver armeniacum]|nr:hypothetical protein MKW92_042288 [Papaver armeniacum]